jgi:hypothetical protein
VYFIQSDQKENRAGVANHRSRRSGTLRKQAPNAWAQKICGPKRHFIMNFRRWNFNSASYYYHLIMEKKNKQEQHFTFVRMGNLPALLPNATPLLRNVNFKATVLSFG